MESRWPRALTKPATLQLNGHPAGPGRHGERDPATTGPGAGQGWQPAAVWVPGLHGDLDACPGMLIEYATSVMTACEQKTVRLVGIDRCMLRQFIRGVSAAEPCHCDFASAIKLLSALFFKLTR